MNKYIKGYSSTEIPVYSKEFIEKIASDLVYKAVKLKKHEQVMIYYDIGGRQLARELAKLCSMNGSRVWYKVRDLDVDATIIESASEKEIARYFSFVNSEIMQADTIFLIRAPRTPDVLSSVSAEKMALYNKSQAPIYMDYRVEHTNWELIYMPTQYEADFEGLDYEEYVAMFYNACNQPWDDIRKAQDILCDILNLGKYIEFTADPNNTDSYKRTSVSMSIEGMTFYNSTIDNNYPGSEVFSSPVKESVNGQIFAGGRKVLGHESKFVRDVYFEIKDGKIVKAKSSENESDMNEMLDRDSGGRYFGEIAIGTNPGLRRNVLNGLLNEKVGGSFHITPGRAYEYKLDSEGRPVHVFNGNISSIHWDITIMMLPEYGGGEIKVDGKTIQKNGRFIIPGLEILNTGL